MTRTFRTAAFGAIFVLQAMVQGCGLVNDSEALVARAQEYRKNADYKAAIIELKNALQKNPEHAEARYLLGVTYNDTGDFASAEEHLRRALERGYDSGKVIPALGRSLLMTGKFQKVLDEVKVEGETSDRARAEVLTVRALASLGLGHKDEARNLLDQALAKQPGYADALLGQARIAASEKKVDEAARLIDTAIEAEPKSAEAWLMRGEILRFKGDNAGAAAAYSKILEFNPTNVRARLSIASLDLANGQSEQARKQLGEVRKIAPGNLMATYMHALIELRDKNYTAAKDAILQVLKVAPDHLPSLLLAGAAETALGSQEQAQLHLRRVVERTNSVYARKLLATSLGRSGRVADAIAVLQPVLKQAPHDLGLLVLAGELYMGSGEFEKAEQYFEKAAKHAPKNAAIRTSLGASRLAGGDTESALADLESAVQLDSDQYRADILLVTSHLRQKNYDEALKAAQKLQEKQPNNPLTYNLMAGAFIGKKDFGSARKHLEHALELQPAYVPAAINLARLDLQDKNPQAARRRLEAILEKEKDNVPALLGLAGLGPSIGATPKEQIAWVERARKASPKSVQPHLMLARLHSQQGDRKAALEAAQQAQAVRPENPQVLEVLGASQMNAGQKEQALQTFRRLVTLMPDSPAALHHLARAEGMNGNEEAAVSALKKALAIKPDFVTAQLALFQLELKAKRYPEALKIARQIQGQSSKSPIGFVLEGDALMAEKKFAQAARAYEKAYETRKSGLLAIKLHDAHTRAGKPKDADARLTQWLKESPNDAAARIYAAEISIKRGDYKQAVDHYESLPEKQQNIQAVLNNLAWSYHKLNDPRALETAERAYNVKPDNPAVADTLGTILIERGDAKRGVELLRKAVNAAPKAHEIRYHLAQGLAKAGDKAAARDELERLLADKVQFAQREEAQKLLKQLSN